MRNTTFANKEEYLAYRKQWKADYKELSEALRVKKFLRRTAASAFGKAEAQVQVTNSYGKEWLTRYEQRQKLRDTLLDENKRYTELYDKYKDVRVTSADATRMLIELKEAKIRAQEQYLAEKAALVS